MAFKKPSKKLIEVLAENVRALRKSKGLSQEDLASLCELHRTYVGSIERAERNVTLSTLEILSKSLNVPISQLLSSR